MKKLWLILLKQSTSTLGPVEGFANALNGSSEVPAISMKHWSPWNGCAHLNIAYLLRAASVPHIPSFCSVLLWETIVFFILCCSDCHYNCLLIHFFIICIFLGNPLLLPIVLYIYVWSLLIDFQEKFVYIR